MAVVDQYPVGLAEVGVVLELHVFHAVVIPKLVVVDDNLVIVCENYLNPRSVHS